MGQTLFKEVSYNLETLINNIDTGDIGLPDIQRPFVWKNNKVRNLFDSMYRGFPIGYLLFWQNALGKNGQRQVGSSDKQNIPNLLIVDGQQRLTSLYAVIKGIPVIRENYEEEIIKIAFRPRDGKFEVTDAAVSRDPEYIPNISTMWADDSDIFEVTDGFFDKLEEKKEVTTQEKKLIRQNISQLHNLKKYPFTALELVADVDEEQVSEIFVRINYEGKKLNQSDFILTLMSVFWDDGRAQIEDFCRDSRQPDKKRQTPFNYFIDPEPKDLLRVNVGYGFKRARMRYVYQILRGKDLETGKVSEERRIKQFSVLKKAQEDVLNLQNWHDFLKTIMRAGFKSGKMITSDNNLLFAYILFLIGLRDFKIDRYELKEVVSQWFFMSNITGRYTGSPASAMEKDLNWIQDLDSPDDLINELQRISDETLTEDFWNITLPNDLATSSSRSPSLFAYHAAQCLLDAKVLFSNSRISDLLDPAVQGSRSAMERHHLFPKNYLHQQGITDFKQTNQIANFALVEWDDNNSISDQNPADYLPRYLERFDDQELKKMYYWHALPEGWESMDYEQFIEKRRKMMAEVVRDGYKKLVSG